MDFDIDFDGIDNETVLCKKIDEHTVSCDGVEYVSETLLQPSSTLFWVYLGLYMVLVLFAGRIIAH